MATRRYTGAVMPEHSTAVIRRAEQITSRKRNPSLVFSEVRDWANSRFNTNYSIYQISAVLGNAGYCQSRD